MNSAEKKEQLYKIINTYNKSKEMLIQILLELQEASGYNYLPEEWMKIVAFELDLPLSNVHNVATFYEMFSTEPRGKHLIEVCNSGPCHVNNSKGLVDMLEKNLGIKMGETTQDKLFTLTYSSCFGGCEVSPAIKIGENIYGNLDEEKIEQLIKNYRGV